MLVQFLSFSFDIDNKYFVNFRKNLQTVDFSLSIEKNIVPRAAENEKTNGKPTQKVGCELRPIFHTS